MAQKPNTKFFLDLTRSMKKKQSHFCVGLDADYDRIPQSVKKGKSVSRAVFEFNKRIIEATHDLVVAYKPNLVFYGALGVEGWKALRQTNEYIKSHYNSIKIFADCKRSEMGRSADMAAREIFDQFLFDAIMVTPWFGLDTLAPYQEYKDKAVFVYCHDSNPSATEVQDLILADGSHVYEKVTELVCGSWNESGNVFIEAPLTYPKQLARIGEIAKDKNQLVLLAGLGAQGGDLSQLALFKEEKNCIVSASRAVLYASEKSDFALKAREVVEEYRSEINTILYR